MHKCPLGINWIEILKSFNASVHDSVSKLRGIRAKIKRGLEEKDEFVKVDVAWITSGPNGKKMAFKQENVAKVDHGDV